MLCLIKNIVENDIYITCTMRNCTIKKRINVKSKRRKASFFFFYRKFVKMRNFITLHDERNPPPPITLNFTFFMTSKYRAN